MTSKKLDQRWCRPHLIRVRPPSHLVPNGSKSWCRILMARVGNPRVLKPVIASWSYTYLSATIPNRILCSLMHKCRRCPQKNHIKAFSWWVAQTSRCVLMWHETFSWWTREKTLWSRTIAPDIIMTESCERVLLLLGALLMRGWYPCNGCECKRLRKWCVIVWYVWRCPPIAFWVTLCVLS